MSSSEDWVVERSEKRMPALRRSPSRLVMPVALAPRVVIIGELAAVFRQHQAIGRERGRDGLELVLQMQRQALLAELLHQVGLVLHQDDFALVDDADAVGHLLGLFDVMRGEDDGNAGGAQLPHHFPHALAQLDVDARGGLVQEQDLRFMRQRLGDHHAALHAAGQRDDLGVLLVPQRQRLQHLLDMCGVFRLAEQAAGKADGRPHRFERIGVQFLRHQPDQRACRAVIGVDVMAADQDAAVGQIGDAADDADQRGFAGTVRPEQRKDFAAPDLEVDVVQRLETGAIGF